MKGTKGFAQAASWQQAIACILGRDENNIEVTGEGAMLKAVVEQVELRAESGFSEAASSVTIFAYDHWDLKLPRNQ
jgi:hypothetical protein